MRKSLHLLAALTICVLANQANGEVPLNQLTPAEERSGLASLLAGLFRLCTSGCHDGRDVGPGYGDAGSEGKTAGSFRF